MPGKEFEVCGSLDAKNCPLLARGSSQKTHGSLDSGGELQKGVVMTGRNCETSWKQDKSFSWQQV